MTVCSLNRQQNARAGRDAAAWDRRRARLIRQQERARREPPLPLAPRLPAFARTSRWTEAGAALSNGAPVRTVLP